MSLAGEPTLGEILEYLGKPNDHNRRRQFRLKLEKLGKRHGLDLVIASGHGTPVRVRWSDAAPLVCPHRSSLQDIEGPEWHDVLRQIAGDEVDRKIDQRVMPRLNRLESGQESNTRAIRQLADSTAKLAKRIPKLTAGSPLG